MAGLQLEHCLDHDGVAVLRLTGDLDGSSAAAYREELRACCAGAAAVIIDGAHVRSCELAALELLVSGRQAVTSAGGRFVLAAPSFALAKALRVTDLASAFTVTSTVDAAHAKITGVGAATRADLGSPDS